MVKCTAINFLECVENCNLFTAGVALVPSLVCVQSGSGTARGLQEVVHAGSSLDLQRFHRCTLAGTEPDAFREALNAVQELASDYDLGL